MARPPTRQARLDRTRYLVTIHRPGKSGNPPREWFDDLEDAQDRAEEIVTNGEGVPTISAKEIVVATDPKDDETPLVSLAHVRDVPQTPDLEGADDFDPPNWFYRPLTSGHKGRVHRVKIETDAFQFVCESCGKRGPAFLNRAEAERHEQIHLNDVENGPYSEVLEDEDEIEDEREDEVEAEREDERPKRSRRPAKAGK
ncbi:MAG: hypothetical protein M3O70_00810 [Actinomycetota bacterium]|nr:hypothetical protein [Actinomycetota bacterium]